MIYFQGGGWCYSVADCIGRSKGTLGSSSQWATTGSIGGIMSNNNATNPYFAGWSKVWLGYCDGNSFSGSTVYNANGTLLHFNGHAIIDAALNYISTTVLPGAPGLFTAAERVLLTGCSAGGLATYLHADYVGAYVAANLPKGTMYGAISISGFFLQVRVGEARGGTSLRRPSTDGPSPPAPLAAQSSSVIGEPIYADQIKSIHYLSNATYGVNAACVAAQSPGYGACACGGT